VHFQIWPVTVVLTFGLSLSAFSQNKLPNRITRAIDERETVVLQGNVRPQVRAAVDQGRMDGGQRLRGVSMVFKRSAAEEAALRKLLSAQQDPSSANYHKWLTPEEYGDRFGLSADDLKTVTSWLQGQGFTVDRVARGRTQLWFTGPISQIETVFRTEMHRYLVDGELHFANGTELAVPAALGDVVLGIHNLDDFRPRARVRTRKQAADATAHLTSNLSGFHYIAPDDFATIYNVDDLYNVGLDGADEKLAVVGQSTIRTSDLDAFRSAASLPARTSANFQQVQVPNSGTAVESSGDVDESSLDLEWSAAVAKGATVIFVFTGNSPNFNVFDSLEYAVDQNLAPVISMSYGNCEANLGTFLNVLQTTAQQAVAQGQNIVAASGDSGAADCDLAGATSATHGLAVDAPGVVPEVTSIGGTQFTGDAAATVDPNNASCYLATSFWSGSCSLTSGGSALMYIPETTWNDGATSVSAGGGGVSTKFAKPTWQTGTGVPADGKRDVPDVSLNASPNHDGYLLCSLGSCTNGFRDGTNTFNVAGGTSFGAPGFAGIVAILNQATQSGGQGSSFNSTLYSMAASHPSAFHDVTTGTNKVPCASGSTNCPTSGTLQIGYSAGVGYDLATGLGSVDAFNLVTAWPGFVSTPTYSMSSSPNSITIAKAGLGGSTTVSITALNGFTGTVKLSCAVSSTTAEITCSVPATATVTSGKATANLSVTTTAPHAVPGPTSASQRVPSGWLGGSLALIAGAVLVGAPTRRRWNFALGLILLTIVFAAVGCGGSSNNSTPKNPGTPAGTYTVTVTGTSGSTSRTTAVSVTVQ
jgi:subtilase family serine protease